MVSLLLFTCSNNVIAQQSITVVIGTQFWSGKNLEVSSFRNGEVIPEARTNAEWQKAGEEGKPAWCYYKNDPANGKKYGKLYNWFAVNDPRGLAPKDWHIPTNEDWITLTDKLGGEVKAGLQMRSTIGWKDNKNGRNSSGFAGLPAGYRDKDGTFRSIGESGNWWSSTEELTGSAGYRFLAYSLANLNSSIEDEQTGFSVRILSDLSH